MSDDLINPYAAPSVEDGGILPADDDRENAPLSLREESAQRALKAALLALLLFPLQFYVLWLLMKVCFHEGPLKPLARRKAIWAAVISCAHIFCVGALMRIA